jgi:hypothetical protein
MVSSQTNVSSFQQSFINNILQQSQQNCLVQSTNTASNNVTIINGATIDGNVIGVTITAHTDASCLMTSSMEDSVQNMLSAILQQANQAATDIMNGGQITMETNTFSIDQSVTNNISQINQTTCSVNTSTSTNNNYLYVSGKVGGNVIGVTQATDTKMNCSVSNIMKNTTYNQAQASATQSNTAVGMFALMFAVIGGIIGLFVIGYIIYYATGSSRNVGYQAPRLTREQEELQAAQTLGLGPEELQILAEGGVSASPAFGGGGSPLAATA